MKILSLLLLLGLSCALCASAQQGLVPPGQTAANNAVRSGERLEPPMIHPRQKVDPVKLQREAEELKTLAASVERQMHLVGQGQLPATLPKNLKRIAKLTHQLRLQLSR